MSRSEAFVVVMLILIAFAPAIGYAQIPAKIVPCNGVDCNVCHIAQLAQNVLNIGIYIAVFLSAVLFAYAGWLYIIAGGESGKVSQAKSIFFHVGVGLVLILGAWLVIDLIMKTLVNENAIRGPWNAICP